MKIKIPNEYLTHFENGSVYVTRWKKPALLFMNGEENDDLERMLEQSRVHCKDGIVRFIKAGIFELEMEEGVVDVPEGLAERLEGENRSFSKEKAGIKVL